MGMLISDVELEVLRERWLEGKYRTVQEALEHIVPQAEWMDLCDAIAHPVSKRLANDLRGVQLREQNLKNLDLGDSFLDFAVFDGSRFDGAQFQWSIMNGALFRECTLRLTQMIIVFGEAIDFRGATFERAYIDHAQIDKSNFSTAVMQGGTLSNSNVKDCDFSGMQFANGKFGSNDARRGNFSAARFVDCNFSQSLLNEARLVGTSFDNCDLSGVDFRGANLEGVDFRAGTFWSVPDGMLIHRTRFDDTPEARRAIERSTVAGKEGIEWCAVAPLVAEEPVALAARDALKGWPGEVVPRSGWWISPALRGEQRRRHLNAGDTFPDVQSTDPGLEIWSYDSDEPA